MATALAVPLQTDAGTPIPGRELIVFTTFVVVLTTVVGQGLTLPTLIRRLGIGAEGGDEETEELRARLVASRAALAELDALATEGWVREDVIEPVRRKYKLRKRRFAARAGKITDDGYEEESLTYQRILYRLYRAERQAIIDLRNSGEISNDVMHRLERELDLAESHLEPTVPGDQG